MNILRTEHNLRSYRQILRSYRFVAEVTFKLHLLWFWKDFINHFQHTFSYLYLIWQTFWNNSKFLLWSPLREKCPNTRFFLVRIFLYPFIPRLAKKIINSKVAVARNTSFISVQEIFSTTFFLNSLKILHPDL